MAEMITTGLVLLSLLGILFYSVIGFLGFVSFFSVVSARERDSFLKVFYVSILFAASLCISLVSFFVIGMEFPLGVLYLGLTLSCAFVPVLFASVGLRNNI